MKWPLSFIALILTAQVHAQQGSIHYTGQMTPAYTGRSTPYTGQMTPAYTGRSTPYTGQSSGVGIPAGSSKSGASIHRSVPPQQRNTTGVIRQQPMYHPDVGAQANTLPPRYRSTFYNGYYYYYGGGSYYRGTATPLASPYSTGSSSGSGVPPEETTFTPAEPSPKFEVVDPPIGMVVDELPPGTREVKKGLYMFRDIRYRPIYSDGKIKYIVSRA